MQQTDTLARKNSLRQLFTWTTSCSTDSRVRWIAVFILTAFLFGCRSTKVDVNLNEVKNGNNLNKAKEITLDTFLIVWIENVRYSKVDFNLHELYKDSTFTYFGKQTFKYQVFCKINNDTLKRVDYKSIDGDTLRGRFFHEIIPLKDRQKSKNCSSYYSGCDFKYRFIENEDAIEIKCHYKIVCELLIPLLNKDYIAKYDIKTKSFKYP